jgi:hypothetical protein
VHVKGRFNRLKKLFDSFVLNVLLSVHQKPV